MDVFMDATFVCTIVCLLALVVDSNPEEPIEMPVLRHSKQTLPCPIDFTVTQSSTQVEVRWFRRTTNSNRDVLIAVGVMALDRKMEINKVGNNEWNLVISRIDGSDEGLYKCVWSRPGRRGVAQTYLLLVESPPSVDKSKTTESHVIYREGRTVNLTCVMAGKPQPTIRWFRRHRAELTNQQSLGVTGSVLTIPDITRHAGDVYICVGENRHKKRSWEIDLRVKFKPSIHVFKSVISAKSSQSVHLSCLVEASTDVEWHWYAPNGDRIKPNYKYAISDPTSIEGYPAEVSTLTLREYLWDSKDYGPYRCQATTIDHKTHGEILLMRDPRDVG